MEITITIHLHPSATTPSIPQAQGGVVGFPTSVHPQHHNTAPSLILWRRLSLLLLGLPTTTTTRVMYNKGYINLTLVFHCSQRRDMWMWCEWRGWPFCLPPPPLHPPLFYPLSIQFNPVTVFKFPPRTSHNVVNIANQVRRRRRGPRRLLFCSV